MFKLCGKMSKIFAYIWCISGVVAAIWGAISLFGIEVYVRNQGYEHPFIFLGIITLLLGSAFSWLSANVIYAIGTCADKESENSGSFSMFRDRNWTCSNCQTNNPVSRITCSKCGADRLTGKAKDGSAKPVMTESKPAPLPTWTCPNCKTLNPVSKATCKNCGTVK